ncbi:MAG: hypothetical protein V4772_27040 [Pseudomonadota bacterium]
MKTPQQYDRFTLAYLRAVLSEAKKDEQILSRAQATLQRLKLLRGDAPLAPCHQEWFDLLHSNADVIESVVFIETEFAAEMRKNSPFAGVLPPQQRLALLRQSAIA